MTRRSVRALIVVNDLLFYGGITLGGRASIRRD